MNNEPTTPPQPNPNENPGLVDKLRSMLTEANGGKDELRRFEEERTSRRNQALEMAELRRQAVEELTGENGVVTAGPEEIEAKMREIASQETPNPDNA